MKRFLFVVLACLLIVAAIPVMAEEAVISGAVAEIEKYGHARLDITIEDFERAGFALGDIVTVSAGSYTGDMPYLNGYYVDRGDAMLRAYPGHDNIALCINYGRFAEASGVDVGDPVTIALKEKAGALTLQEINNLVYTDLRSDSASDEAFANFRPIVDGKLYRSASPVDNQHNRARYADALIRDAGIRTVMNLANTEEEIEASFDAEDFASPYYRELYEAGRVIVLGMGVDFASDEFAEGIVRGYTFLTEGEPPYLVHCIEGKDRAGFAAMLLETLMGWSEAQIVEDYMVSYANYYGIEPGTEKYDLIAERNVKEMLRNVAGLEKGVSLEGIDLKAAAEDYLLRHGMEEETLAALETELGD